MADGSFPTLVSIDRDPNSSTNGIYTLITDNTNVAGVDASNNLQVILAANSGVDIGDVDVTSVIPGTGATNLGKAVDSAAGGTDVGVAALAVRDDALTTLTPVDGDYTHLRVDSTGALWITSSTLNNAAIKVDDSAFTVASDSVSVSGFLADETTPDSVDEGDVGAARMTLDRKQLMVLADATTDSQRLAIDASGNAQVDLAAVSVTAVPVSADSNANAETNPLYVYNVNSAVSGDEFHDYDTAASVAADGTSNHDYTVVNTTGLLKQITLSSSGGSKCELQAGPLASLATVWVGFVPREGGSLQHTFTPAVEATGTTPTFRMIRTNRQNQTQDLYSTMEGNDI